MRLAEQLIEQAVEGIFGQVTPYMKKVAQKLKHQLGPDTVRDYGLGTLELQWGAAAGKGTTGTLVMIRQSKVGISQDIDRHVGPGSYKKVLRILGNPRQLSVAKGSHYFDWYELS